MVRFGQLVMGPAGSGKSTYCTELSRHCEDMHRTVHVVNLDPAAESFAYPVAIDVRELISVDDVTEELRLGPNGGLVFCMEYLLDNLDWLDEKISDYLDDEYLVFDLPGQIELYTHFPVMRRLTRWLTLEMEFRLCAVYLLDSQFMVDSSKFFGGALSALSAMVQLEIPHVNVLSKMDLAAGVNQERLEEFLYPDIQSLIADLNENMGPTYVRLNQTLGALLEEFNMVNFTPLDVSDPDSIHDLLLAIDHALQYDETRDVHDRDQDANDDPDD
mmetsp:Transcript_8350/g.17014  ORF Transcript_8350/g.17014 Transcript_8350/m.17014 type:complete len:273 (-) Transcript_8350:305-1123(-)